jgi:hypothetical protein
MATAAGLTFTIGQITSTTGSNDFVVTTMEEVQIQSASTTSPTPALTTTTLALAPPAPAPSLTTPATHRLLPRYQGRKLNNIDLIDSIDRLGGKLSFTLALVDSLQEQFTEQNSNGYNKSTRPARATRFQRLGTDLVVTSTPEGRSAQPRPRPRNFVNMVGSDQVSIHTTQTDSRLSSGSSIASDETTQTMVLHHVSNGDEERLYPTGFPQILAFPPRRDQSIATRATTAQCRPSSTSHR